MISTFALLSSILFASAAVVDHSQLDAHLSGTNKSHSISHTESPAGTVPRVLDSSDWAGVVQIAGDGTFSEVTGTFKVPELLSSTGLAYALVGIDGYTCDVSLQAGITMTVTNGVASYQAWHTWAPDQPRISSEIYIRTGDVIKATVTASSSTSGEVVIENLTTHEKVAKHLTSHRRLCLANIEWIIGADLRVAPLADFGAVTFTDATATGSSGTIFTPSDARIIDINQNNEFLTSVTTGERTVTIYV